MTNGYIRTISLVEAISKGQSDKYPIGDLKYTVLDTKSVVFRNAVELNEIYQAYNATRGELPPKVPKELICLRPERQLLHEAIVGVTTELRIDLGKEPYDQALKRAVDSVMKRATASPEWQEMVQSLDSYRLEAKERVTRIMEAVELGQPVSIEDDPLYTQIQAFLANTPEGTNHSKGLIAYFTDQLYTERASQAAKEVVGTTIETIIAAKEYDAISLPDPEERITAIVAGGQASGKGTSVGFLEKRMNDAQINKADVVKINTDSYKSFLLNPDEKGAKLKLFSQLTQDEASLIHMKVQQRMQQKAKQGIAPHLLVDQVFLGKDKIDLGLIGGGSVYVIVVSTDVESAMQRSYERGKIEKRFEDNRGILLYHKLMTAQVPQRLVEAAGKDVTVFIFDNNVPRGEMPIPILEFQGLQSAVTIYDLEKLDTFAQKVAINPNAKPGEPVYIAGEEISGVDYIEPLRAVCTIKTDLPEPSQELRRHNQGSRGE